MKTNWKLFRNVVGAAAAVVATASLALARDGSAPRSVQVQISEPTTASRSDLLLQEDILPPGTVIEVPVENYQNPENMPYWNGATTSERRLEFVKGIRIISIPGNSEEGVKDINRWRSVENLFIAKKQLSEAVIVRSNTGTGERNQITLNRKTSLRRNDGRPVIPQKSTHDQDAEEAVRTVERMNDAVAGAGSQQTYGACSKDVYRKFIEAGVPERPLRQALARLAQNRDHRIKNTNYMAIADFTKDSNKKRFFILNLQTGEVDALYTAHGRGLGAQTNTHLHAKYFDRGTRIGSFLTPPGFHVTPMAIDYKSKKGPNLRLEGLEARNRLSSRRGILIHGKDRQYATEEFIRRYGAAGRSEGCLTIDPRKLMTILNKLKGGALVYNYVGE